MYKAELTIPTEQYGNIRPVVEGTAEEIVAAYFEFKSALGGEGIPDKEFDQWLDRYLTENTGDSNVYARMSAPQRATIQTIKRSINRIKARQEK